MRFKAIALFLFCALLIIGFKLSEHKLLWMDELFTQKETIEVVSYPDIFMLRFPEGNKSPLFYLIQKAVSDVTSTHLPVKSTRGMVKLRDYKSQVVLRIPSNVFMSLALVLIFYYFSRRFSLGGGIFAFITALCTPLVWTYWVEARPYSLWFLLTTLQLFLVWDIYTGKKIRWGWLTLVNFLLAMTVIGSLIQIAICLFILVQKRLLKVSLWSIFLIPIAIDIIYMLLAPMFPIKVISIWYHFVEAFMPERLIVFIWFAWIFWKNKQIKNDAVNSFFLQIFLLFLTSSLMFLCVYHFKTAHQFDFNSRYLIFAVPLDICAMSVGGIYLYRYYKSNREHVINFSMLMGGLIIIRALLTYQYLISWGTYLHVPGKL